jgi:hypothetical protein
VLDTNDNAPKFVQPNTTEFRIFENNEPGAVIAQFKATDSDSSEYGQVVYSLLNGGTDKFEIDPIDVIKTLNKRLLSLVNDLKIDIKITKKRLIGNIAS